MEKRIIILVMMFALMGLRTQAQQWTFAPEVGISLSNFTDGGSSYLKTGVRTGVAVQYDFKNNPFGIKSGLYYSQKGGNSSYGFAFTTASYNQSITSIKDINWDNPASVGFSEVNTRLDYLELPVLANYKFKFADNYSISLSAGPYLAYGITGKIKYEYLDWTREENVNNPQYDSRYISGSANPFKDHTLYANKDDAFYAMKGASRFDWGFNFGTEFAVMHWHLGVNYSLGLKNTSYSSQKNRSFNVMLGYSF